MDSEGASLSVTDSQNAERAGKAVLLVVCVGRSSSDALGGTRAIDICRIAVLVIAAFAGILGAGFALVNTPLAATVSRIVRSQVLASALRINSMLFFLGGSLGAAMMMAVVTSRGEDGASLLNPLHSGAGSSFSDGFLLLAIPVSLVMVLSPALPKALARSAPMQPGLRSESNWVPSCSVPWTPDRQEITAGELECFPVADAEYASSPSS